MKVVNTSDGGIPNLDGVGRIINDNRVVAVLTQDDSGLYAVYIAVVRYDPVRLSKDAVNVAHNGQKLSYDKARWFFPGLQQQEYRA